MEKDSKIYVAGHRGLVGSAIWKNLQSKGYTNLVGRTHKELDLLDGTAVKKFFDEEQPEYVVLAAAFVGGIMANSIYRADFIYRNLRFSKTLLEKVSAITLKNCFSWEVLVFTREKRNSQLLKMHY